MWQWHHLLVTLAACHVIEAKQEKLDSKQHSCASQFYFMVLEANWIFSKNGIIWIQKRTEGCWWHISLFSWKNGNREELSSSVRLHVESLNTFQKQHERNDKILAKVLQNFQECCDISNVRKVHIFLMWAMVLPGSWDHYYDYWGQSKFNKKWTWPC